MDDHQQHVIETFERDGGGYSYVVGYGEQTPSYIVTFGWSVNYKLPEMILFGAEIMGRSLLRLYEGMIDALEDMPPIKDELRWPMTWNGHPVIGRTVHSSNVREDWFADALMCRRRAGMSDEMPAYQLCWPDLEGRMPWDGGSSATHRWLQPPLYQPADQWGRQSEEVPSRVDMILLNDRG